MTSTLTPTQAAALGAELLADPTGIGYAGAVAGGEYAAVAVMLNSVRAGSPTTWHTAVASYGLRARVAMSEFLALTDPQKRYLEFILNATQVDTSSTQLQSDVASLFGPATATRANWLAYVRYKPTRAEELFGEGFVVTADNVKAVLLRRPHG